jgi:hypothetical protein
MALGSGVSVIAAFKQASDWWTAVDCNVPGAGIRIETDGLPIGAPELIPDTSLGSPWERGNDLGNTIVDGPINIKARYDSLGVLWALCFGAADVPIDLGNGAYRHVLTLTADTAGYFGTYCVYDGVAVREATSCKLTGFELRGTGGQALDLTFPTMCDDRIIDSTVNTTAAALGAVTYSPYDYRVIFDDVLIRINAQAGAALEDSDAFYASDFSITLNRPHEAPFVTNRRSTRSEPIANGKPTIRITANEASYVDTSRITALKARTPYKMDIEMLGANVIGTSAYYFRIYFEMPAVFYSATRYPINGSSRIIPDLEWVCELSSSATVPGMVGLVNPMRLTLDMVTSDRLLA